MIYRTAKMIFRNEIFNENGESQFHYYKYHKKPNKTWKKMNDEENPRIIHKDDLNFLLQAYKEVLFEFKFN